MKLTSRRHGLVTLSSPSGEVKYDTHLEGGRVWVFLDVVERVKSLAPVGNRKRLLGRPVISLVTIQNEFFFLIWFVRLLALRPLLAYCASLG
jgi:hypothetical protein